MAVGRVKPRSLRPLSRSGWRPSVVNGTDHYDRTAYSSYNRGREQVTAITAETAARTAAPGTPERKTGEASGSLGAESEHARSARRGGRSRSRGDQARTAAAAGLADRRISANRLSADWR